MKKKQIYFVANIKQHKRTSEQMDSHSLVLDETIYYC